MRIWQVAPWVAVVAALGLGSAAAAGAQEADAQEAAETAGGTPSVTVRDLVPLETVLGYVAFEMNVADEQLLQMRRALRGLHAKREHVVIEILASRMGMQEVRSRVFSLRRQMLQSVSTILDESQTRELFEAMGEMPEGDGDDEE